MLDVGKSAWKGVLQSVGKMPLYEEWSPCEPYLRQNFYKLEEGPTVGLLCDGQA